MTSLVEQLSAFLNCEPKNLSMKLSNKETCRRLESLLKWKVLRTNYNDRNGEKKLVYFGLFSRKSAAETKAMGDLRAPYNCTIVQYFFTRHRIQIKYPWLLCASTPNYNKGRVAYFPLELVTLLDPKVLNGNFEESEKTPSIEEIDRYYAKLLKQQDEEGVGLFLRDEEFELMRSRLERFENKMEDKHEEGYRITKEESEALDAIQRNKIIFKKCLTVMKLKNEISILESDIKGLLFEDYRQPVEEGKEEVTEDTKETPEGKNGTATSQGPFEFIDEEPFELQLD
jgi:hypothetical protein